MKMKRAAILIVIALIPFLSDVSFSQTPDQKQKEWTWRDHQGKTRTKAELRTLLQKHKKWLDATIFYGMCTDKSGMLLWSRSPLGIQLAEAEIYGDVGKFSPLNGADLRCANLNGINLSGSWVIGADLRGAFLTYAKLKKTTFTDSNLQGATLDQAKMEGAVLSGVLSNLNLSEASFSSAKLDGAVLYDIDLSKAQFWEADLLNVQFEPKTLPLLRSIASAKNLESMRYVRNPDALTQLRNEFKNVGFREQERKIAYALKRRDADLLREACGLSFSGILPCIYYGLNTALFDWAVQYGMSPGLCLSQSCLL